MTKYLFLEEWNDGGGVRVSDFGEISEKRCEEIIADMEKYSPYDYAVPNVFDSKDKYQSALGARERDKNCDVNHIRMEVQK